MAIILTTSDIEHYRAEFASLPEALAALGVLADCEGDLEDAAISLALQVGQEPTISDQWIDGLAKRWRPRICQAALKETLEDALTAEALTMLAGVTDLPLKLATLVAIYVEKTGIEQFCQPLGEKLV